MQAEAIEPTITSDSGVGSRDRWLRTFELLLVILIAFWPDIYYSLVIPILAGHHASIPASFSTNRAISDLIHQLLALGVFLYVQYRHGRGFRYFGVSFSWKDILSSIGLFIAILIVAIIILTVIPTSAFTRHTAESVLEGKSSVDSGSYVVLHIINVGLIVVNQVLIGCVYLVSEVAALTRSRMLGVFACVILSAALFLVAGPYITFVMAVFFLGFASYYAVVRRATPLVLCYLYFVGLGLIVGSKH